jgi:7-carboxy-7-deazaguanine synthase
MPPSRVSPHPNGSERKEGMDHLKKKYQVQEMFYSLKGEGVHTGRPMLFIRLSGCNLECLFCDTKPDAGVEWTVQDIVNQLKFMSPDCKRVVVTGGEPTMQDLLPLAVSLRDRGYHLHLETNGTSEGRTVVKTIYDYFSWVALSPKNMNVSEGLVRAADEVKFIWDGTKKSEEFIGNFMRKFDIHLESHIRLYLLPLAKSWRSGDRTSNDFIQSNLESATTYCLANHNFSLCYQLHKCLGIK